MSPVCRPMCCPCARPLSGFARTMLDPNCADKVTIRSCTSFGMCICRTRSADSAAAVSRYRGTGAPSDVSDRIALKQGSSPEAPAPTVVAFNSNRAIQIERNRLLCSAGARHSLGPHQAFELTGTQMPEAGSFFAERCPVSVRRRGNLGRLVVAGARRACRHQHQRCTPSVRGMRASLASMPLTQLSANDRAASATSRIGCSMQCAIAGLKTLASDGTGSPLPRSQPDLKPSISERGGHQNRRLTLSIGTE
jgi:hypothetical protein